MPRQYTMFEFYYFVAPCLLYILPMPTTRDGCLASSERFKERATATPIGKDVSITTGRRVPISIVLPEVAGVKK